MDFIEVRTHPTFLETLISKYAGADLGGVDWVAGHPPSEKPTIKIYYVKKGNTCMGPKNIEIREYQPPPINKILDPLLIWFRAR